MSNIEQNKYAGASRGGSLQTLTELKTPLLLSYSTSLSSLSSTTTNSAPWSPDRPEASTHSTSAHPARRIGKAFNKTLIFPLLLLLSSNVSVSGGALLLLPLLLRGASPPPRRTWRPARASTLSGAMRIFFWCCYNFFSIWLESFMGVDNLDKMQIAAQWRVRRGGLAILLFLNNWITSSSSPPSTSSSTSPSSSSWLVEWMSQKWQLVSLSERLAETSPESRF